MLDVGLTDLSQELSETKRGAGGFGSTGVKATDTLSESSSPHKRRATEQS
jgi:hypothetical protein